MGYRILADLTVALHGLFIVFVVLGGFLAWRWRWVAWLHVPCAAWGALIEFAGWICPLTPLEIWLRQRAGLAGYEGGFIEHYLIPLIYPGEWGLGLRIALGSFVIVLNVAAYTIYFRKR